MKFRTLHSLKSSKRSILLGIAMCVSYFVMAQVPTSLSYPTPNVYIANVSNVYLAPSVAGSVSSYSITPTLPTGLSFSTNTGIISGLPVAASAATKYTITATGGSPAGTTTDTISIQVTNNYFNNAYNNINFGGTGVTITNKVGDGTSAGDVVLYQNVATLSGQQIDAIVKTTSLSNGSFSDYDTKTTSGASFSANQERFFSPLFTFTGAGSAAFDFQFILGGTYNSTSHAGLPVVLQNVQINTYDIDGNGASKSNQYNEFGGFNTSELGSAATVAATYDATSNLTKFTSTSTDNSSVVTADPTRVRVTYTNISDFSIVVGAGAKGDAYFFLDFGAGPAFNTAVPTQAPSVDLDTTVIGVNNATSGCGTSLSFSATGQTNIKAAPATLNELSVTFSKAQIKNSASEQLLVDGATAGGTIPLNFADAAAITNVKLGTVTYKVTADVTAGVSKLTFANNTGSTFTLAQAEALLDALKYNNAAGTPTPGDRVFTVNVRNSTFSSPNANFTATLSCVSISGNIYHDVNGLTDSTVNAAGTPLVANAAYAVRVDPSNNHVIDADAISAGGAYTFGTVTPGTYAIYVSATAPTAGTTFTAATYPAGGYVSTGENLGTTAGNDLLIDGKLLVTVGSASITAANFGIEIPPVTANNSLPLVPNPGGFNGYILPNNSFNAQDSDGVVSSITITSFPTGTNYLKIGSTVYISATGTCPPQSTCTTWPDSVSVPFSGGNPTQAIQIDPAAEGNTGTIITFRAIDNGGLASDAHLVSNQFLGSGTYYPVSGNVWHDYNGNGLLNGFEGLTDTSDAGQTLYAVLVQNNNTYSEVPTILTTSVVNRTTGYSFTNVPAGNNYEVHIVSQASAPVSGAAASTVVPHLAQGWIGVSTNSNGTIVKQLDTNNLVITINNLAAAQSNMNFGIERIPTADDKNMSAPNVAFTAAPSITIGGQQTFAINLLSLFMTGTTPQALTGSDPEDCAAASSCSTGDTYVIKSINANTRLFYNFGGATGLLEITATTNNTLANFDPTKLTIYGQMNAGTGANALGFTYTLVDGAGIPSPAATYSLISANFPLAVNLISFTGAVSNCVATLNWETASELNLSYYSVEQSKDAISFNAIAKVPGKNNSTTTTYSTTVANLSGGTYFRLKMVDADGLYKYSQVLNLSSTDCDYSAVAVWPNPMNDIINVSGLTGANNTIIIYNSIGSQVHKLSTSQATESIDVHNDAPGTYLVQIVNKDGKMLYATKLLKK